MVSESHTPLGHRIVGSGARAVVVLNDWLCDTSTWDAALDYLDRERFRWVFADLRGYGRSRSIAGACTVDEGAADVLALADALGLERFAVLGHSMSTLVALRVAQRAPERLTHVALIAPPPPAGFGADAATLEALKGIALGSDEQRARMLATRFGELSAGFLSYKLARWRATSDPAAVARYSLMFARDGLPDRSLRVTTPVLAITGEKDAEPMRRAAVEQALAPLCADLRVVPLLESGHYPMQEAPPLLVAHVERFLGA